MTMDASSVPTLEGAHVRLEPLSLAHHEDLCAVGLDPDIWTWTRPLVQTRDDMKAYITSALDQRAKTGSIPFATVSKASGRAVGSTRFWNIEPEHRRLEVGWTWLGRDWRRTAFNTEAKFLMLRYAFEVMGCMRVELRTDVNNTASRAAILRLGATEEGRFRKHMVMPGNRIRDSVSFSIIDDEWPAVRAKLAQRLQSPQP